MQGFNPRAREGRDSNEPSGTRALTSFNPRAREGRDYNIISSANNCQEVSIHAPARGATRVIIGGTSPKIVSIHAPARGATLRPDAWRNVHRSFNPRAREGRDKGKPYIVRGRCCFNPRAREGRDSRRKPILVALEVSIHAPARGATMEA